MTVYKKAVQVCNSTVCIGKVDRLLTAWYLHPNTETKCSYTNKLFDDHTHNAYCMEVSWNNTCTLTSRQLHSCGWCWIQTCKHRWGPIKSTLYTVFKWMHMHLYFIVSSVYITKQKALKIMHTVNIWFSHGSQVLSLISDEYLTLNEGIELHVIILLLSFNKGLKPQPLECIPVQFIIILMVLLLGYRYYVSFTADEHPTWMILLLLPISRLAL